MWVAKGKSRAHIGQPWLALIMAIVRTFRDMGNSEEILAKLEEIAHHLEDDLEYGKWAGRTVVVKYKVCCMRCVAGLNLRLNFSCLCIAPYLSR